MYRPTLNDDTMWLATTKILQAPKLEYSINTAIWGENTKDRETMTKIDEPSERERQIEGKRDREREKKRGKQEGNKYGIYIDTSMCLFPPESYYAKSGYSLIHLED